MHNSKQIDVLYNLNSIINVSHMLRKVTLILRNFCTYFDRATL